MLLVAVDENLAPIPGPGLDRPSFDIGPSFAFFAGAVFAPLFMEAAAFFNDRPVASSPDGVGGNGKYGYFSFSLQQ